MTCLSEKSLYADIVLPHKDHHPLSRRPDGRSLSGLHDPAPTVVCENVIGRTSVTPSEDPAALWF